MSPTTVSAKGAIQKQVVCEKCGHSYGYEMKRTAHGEFWGFAMTLAEAEERAAEDAVEKLKAKLETECDAVACPQCGALTEAMQQSEAEILPLAIGGILFGALLVGVVYGIGNKTGHWFYVIGFLGLALFLVCGLVLVIKFCELTDYLIKKIRSIGRAGKQPTGEAHGSKVECTTSNHPQPSTKRNA